MIIHLIIGALDERRSIGVSSLESQRTVAAIGNGRPCVGSSGTSRSEAAVPSGDSAIAPLRRNPCAHTNGAPANDDVIRS